MSRVVVNTETMITQAMSWVTETMSWIVAGYTALVVGYTALVAGVCVCVCVDNCLCPSRGKSSKTAKSARNFSHAVLGRLGFSRLCSRAVCVAEKSLFVVLQNRRP